MENNSSKIKERPAVGVSLCLLGVPVRHDGGHCEDKFVTRDLAAFVQWVPVCPETEIGLEVPRKNMQLRNLGGEQRLFQPKTQLDLTDSMRLWASAYVEKLRKNKIRGFILKSRSPSCGLKRVRVHHEKGKSSDGVGLFAQILKEKLPLVPLEESGRLNDPLLRERFLERVFAYERWARYVEQDSSLSGLVQFHSLHKIQCMAHDPRGAKMLGRMVAQAGVNKTSIPSTLAAYGSLFMEILGKKPSRGKHINAIEHMSGFVKKILDKDDKAELKSLLDQYRNGVVTRREPLLLLNHHLRKSKAAWPMGQYYLRPFPKELGMDHRN